MRGLSVFLFFGIALASASLVTRHYDTKSADKEFLTKQKNIFHLLYHVHQPNIHQEQVSAGKSYSIEANLDKYAESQEVKQIIQKYKNHLLPQGRIFSPTYAFHMHEAEAFFKVLFYAKDYETFYNTACWAREHLNEQMFVYVLSIAVLHRPDTKGFILPPPYEIQPYYFLSDEVLHQAYQVKMQEHSEHISRHVHSGEGNSIIINSNYTGWYLKYNDEQKLSYFTEDVGLNSFYYYNHLDYPFWMDGEKFDLKKDKRGENFYYIHQQLLARYYLERLSNGLGEIPNFSWNWPVKTGYYPSMSYHNGMSFPIRPNQFDLKQGDFLQHLIQVEDYETRIRNSIDVGFLIKKDGSSISLRNPEDIETLATVIESNEDMENLRYYRYPLAIAKMLLGNSVKPLNWHQVAPSALEQYQTCLRDPMFYQLFKRYVGYFTQFKNVFEPYTKEELTTPGVKIENVEVEKMVTYFDHFDIDITNVVYQTKEEVKNMEDNHVIKARQSRLNHKPFSVTTNVVAEKATQVVFKLFLGPKYNGQGSLMTLNQNRLNFVELDQFVYELKAGKNKVERNSNDFMWNIKDWTPSRQIYQELKEALAGTTQFPLDMSEAHNGFPSRLALPRGRKGGMPFQLFVMVAPYHAPAVKQGSGYDHVISSGVGSGARAVDSLPFGYPFDRVIEETIFVNNNMHFEDVVIFHKKESDINMAVQD